jgi:hypothetical protein
MSKRKDEERAKAIAELKEVVKPGDTLYTILRHVSKSGMSRRISVYSEGMRMLDSLVSEVTGYKFASKGDGLVVSGCGMDMGFHLVYNVSSALYGGYGHNPEGGYKCLGEEGRCPSNYHANHRDRVRCEGVDGKFCYSSSDIRIKINIPEIGEVEGRHAYVVEENGVELVCPTCKGEGYVPNPNGPERWDLVHTDGYAMRQRWL